MNMIIDTHSHILPGIDDGSDSIAVSVSMLRREAEQGIGHVIATPHFYPQHDSPERFLARRKKAETALREAMADFRDLPELSVGAEVYYFPGISESDILPELTIAKKRCILLEMPMSPWTERMYREILDIREKQDIIPIIAHVDRYISPFHTRGIPERLERLPVLVQANAGSFLNGVTRGLALRLLREDRIHLLGSDCHNLTDRAPRLGEAVQVIRRRLGDAPLARMEGYQQAVLDV